MNEWLKPINFLLLIVVGALALCIGLIHHKWFYALQFHGDAASMQVLAKAILEELSLLPKDFSYGNQLVFLRSSPFIAIAYVLGFTEYEAFIVGSSLSIAFWGIILFSLLRVLLNSKVQALALTLCLLIPFGYWDSDFVLGQQSHLSNAVLSIGMVISAYKFLRNNSFLYVALLCVCLFLITAEAPIRGLLVLAPLTVVIFLVAKNSMEIIKAIAPSLLVFLISFVLNKYLVAHRPISLNYLDSLTFKSTGDFLGNFGKTTAETIGSVSGVNILSGSGVSLLGGLVYSLGMLLVFTYIYIILSGGSKLADAIKLRLGFNLTQGPSFRDDGFEFLHLSAIVGIIFGAAAVAALNPDSSRHYLWAIFLFKLIILLALYKITFRFSRLAAPVLIFSISILASTWFAQLIKHDWGVNNKIVERNYRQEIRDIRLAIEKTGINYIYGEDFWRMMPLNALINGLNAQALLLDGSMLKPHHWLTRPSWECSDQDVLYYLKDGPVDKAIEHHLKNTGGVKFVSGSGYEIWIGTRSWRYSSVSKCHESSLRFQGQSLATLPSTVGRSSNDSRITDGRSGFLIFGPYLPLKSGTYELTVHGFSNASTGSYIDVVSASGAVVHARFDLADSDAEFLLKNRLVHISEDTSDIEVRLYVGANDVINLKGYELIPKGTFNGLCCTKPVR